MFTYEETDGLFGIKGDLDVFKQVFYRDEGVKARQAGVDGEQRRPEYRLTNKYFVALSFAELVLAVEDLEERAVWTRRVEEVKRSYGSLSAEFRKRVGIAEVGSDAAAGGKGLSSG